MKKLRFAIAIYMKKRAIALSNTKKSDRPFHITKNSQKAIALFDLFPRGDRSFGIWYR
ncbi:MAG: hypothetical protein HC941_26970 [Microcoleus sp. SU_5_3]|nr:hypothetical protein [Microcoleus sp. SU_5_3]